MPYPRPSWPCRTCRIIFNGDCDIWSVQFIHTSFYSCYLLKELGTILKHSRSACKKNTQLAKHFPWKTSLAASFAIAHRPLIESTDSNLQPLLFSTAYGLIAESGDKITIGAHVIVRQEGVSENANTVCLMLTNYWVEGSSLTSGLRHCSRDHLSCNSDAKHPTCSDNHPAIHSRIKKA